jgi:2-polyprenyl-3-methyl-5-hydroxy-6-metoxy-1,4-benzoquinol methylase
MAGDQLSCYLCKGNDLSLITKKVRFDHQADVYACQACGLVFLDQNSFVFPKDFYEKEYHQTYITHIEPDAFNPHAYYEKMKKANKIWADKFATMLTGQEIVLDVGCSTGHFIDMIKDKTKKIYGHELNHKEVEFCKNVLKLDVSNQPLEKRFAEGTFDYITLIYVLEHIADPKPFLTSLGKLLKPEGKLVILIPNVQDALVNFYDLPEFTNFYYCIEHLFYYSQKTIARLFQDIGATADIEILQEYPITNHLNWAYLRGPSDTLAARKGVPNVPLKETAPEIDWENLWQQFNQLYQSFLKEHGYGDRLWCVAGKGKK